MIWRADSEWDYAAYSCKICPVCGLERQKPGYDPCLGKLPGVQAACCGHNSNDTTGYIWFDNDVIIYFKPLSIRHHGQKDPIVKFNENKLS